MFSACLSAIAAILPGTSLPADERTLARVERGWHEDLVTFTQHGLPKIVAALFVGFILIRITKFFVKRMRVRADSLVANGQHAAQLRTLASIIRATAYGIIGAYVFLQILGAVGVPLGPFIASAGVIGLGISFGAQSIFKDVLNGIFILVENQYNVGEVVKIAGLTGSVEDLTLRCTTLRDGDGTVYIVPNSQVATVSNLSRDFSVATLTVAADASADPERVIKVLQDIAAAARSDDSLKDIVLADPSVLGVDKIDGRSVSYLLTIRVRANQRDGVLRDLRRRILQTFAAERIPLATATTTVINAPDPTATPKA